MTDLSQIITALEKAEGPSRELDAAIGETLGLMPTELTFMPPPGYARYTASLDDATALVERLLPGTEWQAGTNHATIHEPWAVVRSQPLLSFGETAANVPLAICIAAIRAYAALKAKEASDA